MHIAGLIKRAAAASFGLATVTLLGSSFIKADTMLLEPRVLNSQELKGDQRNEHVLNRMNFPLADKSNLPTAFFSDAHRMNLEYAALVSGFDDFRSGHGHGRQRRLNASPPPLSDRVFRVRWGSGSHLPRSFLVDTSDKWRHSGTASGHTVPESGTLLLVGMGLFGLAAATKLLRHSWIFGRALRLAEPGNQANNR